jgi:hypothetical protein
MVTIIDLRIYVNPSRLPSYAIITNAHANFDRSYDECTI